MTTRAIKKQQHLLLQRKLNRIRKSGMPFKMRLAAFLAADNREGQVWRKPVENQYEKAI